MVLEMQSYRWRTGYPVSREFGTAGFASAGPWSMSLGLARRFWRQA